MLHQLRGIYLPTQQTPPKRRGPDALYAINYLVLIYHWFFDLMAIKVPTGLLVTLVMVYDLITGQHLVFTEYRTYLQITYERKWIR